MAKKNIGGAEVVSSERIFVNGEEKVKITDSKGNITIITL